MFFHGRFTEAAAGLLGPKVALIALMDIVPLNSPIRLGLTRSGAFWNSFDKKSKYDPDSHMTMLVAVYVSSSVYMLACIVRIFTRAKQESKRDSIQLLT